MMPQAATINPEMTALAARHISASPAVRSFSLKMGIKAAVKAPLAQQAPEQVGNHERHFESAGHRAIPHETGVELRAPFRARG